MVISHVMSYMMSHNLQYRAVLLVAWRPSDFGTIFLFTLLGNFILYLLYYTVTKFLYGEIPSIRPLIFVILAVLFWVGAIFCYTRVGALVPYCYCKLCTGRSLRYVR